MNKSNANRIFSNLAIGIFLCFLVTCSTATAAVNTEVAGSVSLKAAVESMSRGNFESVRKYFERSDISTSFKGLSNSLRGLLSSYDKLESGLQASRQQDYQKHLDELNEKIQLCRWRSSLLESSKGFDVDSDDKKELEQELQKNLDDNWLEALAQLGITFALAERLDVPDTVDDTLRQEIISHGLEVARKLEEEDKGLDAYTKVYYFLEVLDKNKYQFNKLHDRLLRQATLEATYIPDPNAEGITWEEKRKGVDVDMIISALATLDVGYVEKPPYKKMTLKALEYCRLLALTDPLKETFKELGDEEKVSKYRQGLDQLIEEVRAESHEKFSYKNLLIYLDKVIRNNSASVKFPIEVMLAEYTDGAFAATDTYTYVIWPADVAEFRKNMTNEFSGVGVVIRKGEDDYLRAESLVSYDTPAYRANMDANDVILEVDGKSTKGVTIEKAVSMITGPTGTDVVLKVDRDSFDQPQEITVTRKEVVVPTVKGLCRDIDGKWQYMVDEKSGIAYVRLTHFSGETPSSMMKVLKELKNKHGMKGLVFDLRNNSGGYLTGAIAVSNAFIPEGKRIVSSRYRAGQMEDVKFAKPEAIFDADIPMVVLTNSISASASEIVSGALKDNGRALLIGTRTYGKGSVQTIQPLRNSSYTKFTGAQMKMTIAHYYLPNGRCVHRDPKDKTNEDYGVEPHITVELTNEQFGEFVKIQREAGILHHDNLPDVKRDWKTYAPDEMLESDPQLQMALLCLQARLLKDDVILAEAAAMAETAK